MEISTHELLEIIHGVMAMGAGTEQRELETRLRLVEADRERLSELHGKLLHKYRRTLQELLARLPAEEEAQWRLNEMES